MLQNQPSPAEKRLTAQQRQAALLLASGTTIEKTALAVGCHESTIDAWKKRPALQEAIKAAEDEMYNDSLRLLKRTSKAAITTLINCLSEKVSPYVRVQAASKLLDAAMEIDDREKLIARIEELEEIVRTKLED